MGKPWLRLHRKVVESRKVHDLPPTLFKPWVLLLACTDDEGNLPPIDDLVFKLRLPAAKIGHLIEELTSRRFFDVTETGVAAHDWRDWNFESDVSTARVKRFRDRSRNAERNAPDTDTDTDNKAKALSETPLEIWQQVWTSGKTYLTKSGHSEGHARKALVEWRQQFSETEILRALKIAQQNAVIEPIPYIEQVLKGNPNARLNGRSKPRTTTAQALEALFTDRTIFPADGEVQRGGRGEGDWSASDPVALSARRG